MFTISDADSSVLKFQDLKKRYGEKNARVILKTLERSEGVREDLTTYQTYEERLANVFRAMLENKEIQTCH